MIRFDRARRNQRIIELRAEGKTLQDIGAEVGLTRERVRQILSPSVHRGESRRRRRIARPPRSSASVGSGGASVADGRHRLSAGRAHRDTLLGQNARIDPDSEGMMSAYQVSFPLAALSRLEELLGPATRKESSAGLILTATSENLSRVRILSDPIPGYERTATREYLRGDVMRVTGTAKSCNIYLTRVGANLLRDCLASARDRVREWLLLRARVVRRGKHGCRSLIELVPDVDLAHADEDRRLGEGGARLAAQVWPAEDFSDWEEATGG